MVFITFTSIPKTAKWFQSLQHGAKQLACLAGISECPWVREVDAVPPTLPTTVTIRVGFCSTCNHILTRGSESRLFQCEPSVCIAGVPASNLTIYLLHPFIKVNRRKVMWNFMFPITYICPQACPCSFSTCCACAAFCQCLQSYHSSPLTHILVHDAKYCWKLWFVPAWVCNPFLVILQLHSDCQELVEKN